MSGFWNGQVGTARRAVRGRLGEASLPRTLHVPFLVVLIGLSAQRPMTDY